jgi:hypothetical protein
MHLNLAMVWLVGATLSVDPKIGAAVPGWPGCPSAGERSPTCNPRPCVAAAPGYQLLDASDAE